MDMDKTKLADDLTDAFIIFQYRLDNPILRPEDTEDKMRSCYMSDWLFSNKVKCMVAGVMDIICKHIDN